VLVELKEVEEDDDKLIVDVIGSSKKRWPL
jgi:hypothetical protein